MNDNKKVRRNNHTASFTLSVKETFRAYFSFSKMLNGLTNQEIDILTEFVYIRYNLLLKIDDIELVNSIVFSSDNRKKVIDSLGITTARLNTVLSGLRKNGVIIDNVIQKVYLPKLNKDTKDVTINFIFNIDRDSDDD